jgi:hypothetical protein
VGKKTRDDGIPGSGNDNVDISSSRRRPTGNFPVVDDHSHNYTDDDAMTTTILRWK